MKVENMNVEDLIPYEENAKKHDETQIKNVMESIRQFGYAQPIVVDKNNVIIIGHCRLIASKRLNMTEVPVVRMENLTEEETQKLRLLDNKLNESEWDFDLLADQIPELDFDGFDIDWGIPEIVEEEPEIIEDDVPEEVETRCKLGDLWELGDHRLICGDSTSIDVVEKLMNGQKADLLITDPPYNVDYTGKTKDALKIQNDKMGDDSFRQFLRDAFSTADAVMREGAVFYIWHADTEGYNFRGACFDNEWKVRECLIWNKNSLVLGRQDYQWKHEPCLYGWKEGAGHTWNSDRSQTTVLDFDRPTRSEMHPTMKPVALFSYQIKNSSSNNENVLDLFGGSGTTLIACEELHRKAYLCELDPHYCDVIIQRWENLTGKQAVRIEEGDGYVLSEKIDLTDAIKESVKKRKNHGENDEA